MIQLATIFVICYNRPQYVTKKCLQEAGPGSLPYAAKHHFVPNLCIAKPHIALHYVVLALCMALQVERGNIVIGLSNCKPHQPSPDFTSTPPLPLGHSSLKIIFVLTNSVDPDELSHYSAFNLGLHCLQKFVFKGVIIIKRVNIVKLNEPDYKIFGTYLMGEW